MAINDDSKLQKIVSPLASKPGHENVRALLRDLLTQGLDVDPNSIDLEKSLKEIRGRMDALLGRTIIEIKSNLERELKEAENQLLKYLQEKEAGGDSYIGIATDGSVFKVYIRKNQGGDKNDDAVEMIKEYETNADAPRELLIWLESVLVLHDKISPEENVIKMELGRESVFYCRSMKEIARLWHSLEGNSEVETKYSIWKRLLNTAYGSEIEESELFLQHTYLTVVAKSIATSALLPNAAKISGTELLNGIEFRKAGILGAVESDFFDWILAHDDGDKLIKNIANHTQKFNWSEIQTDILKNLYENLIDPHERKGLGEYYTPDWLAEKICRHVIKSPLDERIIDPSCGSGTFLFHSVRLGLEDAKHRNISYSDAITKITLNVSGIDVHPIAVIFARVTYLLALLPALSQRSSSSISLPVYMGDSLQWNLQEVIGQEDLEIVVPAKDEKHNYIMGESNGKGNGRIILQFPHDIAEDANLFDMIINEMLRLAESGGTKNSWEQWLKAKKTSNRNLSMLVKTYESLCILQEQKRNHIWGYVARNLSRPVWLAGEKQKADVIIGNPPWVRYSNMGNTIQQHFSDKMKKSKLWVGGKVATSQDLSCYFYMRVCELYMRRNGRIAFVLPQAILNREAHEKFRSGHYRKPNQDFLIMNFSEAWDLKAVRSNPAFFPVASCVLFAEMGVNDGTTKFPSSVTVFSGNLSKRDAKLSEVVDILKSEQKDLASSHDGDKSFYKKKFRQGAKLKPRILSFVEIMEQGVLGKNLSAPLVKGTTLKSRKWGDGSYPEGQVEAEFIRPTYLSECIAPYITFEAKSAIIPWVDDTGLINSEDAYNLGFEKLSRWLRQVEDIWEKNRKSELTFVEQINYYKSLSTQFPTTKTKVVYTASGSALSASIIEGADAIIESNLYWFTPEVMEEAFYLLAILNSKTIDDVISPWKKGWHFDKIVFNADIPKFSKNNNLHGQISSAGTKAQKLVANMELDTSSRSLRQNIREILYEDGIAGEIDKLVAQLLGLKA